HAGRQSRARHCQQIHGADGRRGTRENPGAGLHHLLHSETPARTVPAEGAGSGIVREPVTMQMPEIIKPAAAGWLGMRTQWDRASLGLYGVLALVAIVVPICNLLIPESSALHISTYTVTLLGKYLCYALLAL